MVRMKSKGCVSNIYVCINIICGVAFAALFSFLSCFDGHDFLAIPFVLIFCVCFMLFYGVNSFKAPFAFKKYQINSNGIYCANSFIPFEDIKSICVERGYVQERFGFRFLEELTGIPQHTDIYLEMLICVNCNFVGYSRKPHGRIYIPLNEKSHKLMLQNCRLYVEVLDDVKATLNNREKKLKKSKLYFLAVLLVIAFLCFSCVLFVANNLINIYKGIIVLTLGVLLIVLLAFKRTIVCFIWNIQVKRMLKTCGELS